MAREQSEAIDATMRAFADACNFVADMGRKEQVSRQFALHKLCYKAIRDRFGLSANLAVRAIARVAPRLAKPKTRHSVFQPTSVDYDCRIFAFRERDWMVSLTLLGGRYRFLLDIGDYQREALRGKTPTAAVLCKKGSVYYINICIDEPTPEPTTPTGCIGVDLGLRDIATASTGKSFSGTKITAKRLKRAKVVRSLQSKAAKGKRSTRRNCRRVLRRLKGRVARFQRCLNHAISKEIVRDAREANASIALEDLTGIRERTNRKLSRKRRGLHNSWAFYQLRQFLVYKAALAGVALTLVDPKYTSQTCSCCGERGERSGKRFACTSCGHVADADVNAARNIARLGLPVTEAEESRTVSGVAA